MFGDEDHTRASGRECSASIVRPFSVFGAENRLFHVFKGSFPEAEVVVVHCEEHVIVERRPLESQTSSIITLSVVVDADELVLSLVLFSALARFYLSLSPVYHD